MAYTGTGTQADPFVVTTFADFLTCVAQDGVYVEVGADLDAAAEGFDYISPIDVKAVEVYGTSGDTLRKISNVTVEGNALFDLHNGTGDQSIIRLHLENWTWKAATTPNVQTHSPIMFYRSNGGGYLHKCKVSVSVATSTDATVAYMENRMLISDCAFVVEQHGGRWCPGNSTSTSNSESYENTTVSVDGTGTASWAVTSGTTPRANKCTNTGWVIKNMMLGSLVGFLNNGEGFSYMVFENCTPSGTSTAVYGCKDSNLICLAGTTDPSSVTVSSGTVVTQAQLKDKAYLQSIGWLP